MRIVLGLEYNGYEFCGWQSQSDKCGVQDVVQEALSRVSGENIRITGAGRTDTGVHASGQVAHFDTDATRPTSAWTNGTNSHLPKSVSVVWAKQIDSKFHARYSAVNRRYKYLLLNRSQRPGLSVGSVGWEFRPLSLEKMRMATDCLVGTHDFSAFRAAQCQSKSPIRTIKAIELQSFDDLIEFDFLANSFLQHMVRNLVGALVEVGSGKKPIGWMSEILSGKDRNKAAPTFSSSGLYLTEVEYGAQWGLPKFTEELCKEVKTIQSLIAGH